MCIVEPAQLEIESKNMKLVFLSGDVGVQNIHLLLFLLFLLAGIVLKDHLLGYKCTPSCIFKGNIVTRLNIRVRFHIFVFPPHKPNSNEVNIIDRTVNWEIKIPGITFKKVHRAF